VLGREPVVDGQEADPGRSARNRQTASWESRSPSSSRRRARRTAAATASASRRGRAGRTTGPGSHPRAARVRARRLAGGGVPAHRRPARPRGDRGPRPAELTYPRSCPPRTPTSPRWSPPPRSTSSPRSSGATRSSTTPTTRPPRRCSGSSSRPRTTRRSSRPCRRSTDLRRPPRSSTRSSTAAGDEQLAWGHLPVTDGRGQADRRRAVCTRRRCPSAPRYLARRRLPGSLRRTRGCLPAGG
jgi:hypothetical protein